MFDERFTINSWRTGLQGPTCMYPSAVPSTQQALTEHFMMTQSTWGLWGRENGKCMLPQASLCSAPSCQMRKGQGVGWGKLIKKILFRICFNHIPRINISIAMSIFEKIISFYPSLGTPCNATKLCAKSRIISYVLNSVPCSVLGPEQVTWGCLQSLHVRNLQSSW